MGTRLFKSFKTHCLIYLVVQETKKAFSKYLLLKSSIKRKTKVFEGLVHVDSEVSEDNDRPWPRGGYGRQGLVHQ